MLYKQVVEKRKDNTNIIILEDSITQNIQSLQSHCNDVMNDKSNDGYNDHKLGMTLTRLFFGSNPPKNISMEEHLTPYILRLMLWRTNFIRNKM